MSCVGRVPEVFSPLLQDGQLRVVDAGLDDLQRLIKIPEGQGSHRLCWRSPDAAPQLPAHTNVKDLQDNSIGCFLVERMAAKYLFKS